MSLRGIYRSSRERAEWESSRSRREGEEANQTAVVVARLKDDWMAGRGEKVEGFVIYCWEWEYTLFFVSSSLAQDMPLGVSVVGWVVLWASMKLDVIFNVQAAR